MSKKNIIISLLFVGLLFIQTLTGVQAQDFSPRLPGAGLTPESRLYFLDQWGEGIQMFFTFSGEGKAQLQVSLIGERVAEIKTMLNREVLNPDAIRNGFMLTRVHTNRASVLLGNLAARADIAPLSATLSSKMTAWERYLSDAVKTSRDALKALAEIEKEELRQRMDEPSFVQAMEGELARIADEIDAELGRPLEGFTIVSYNIDVDDDTYSSTHEAEAETIIDLAVLRDRILAQGIDQIWESGDVTIDNDSLDITFEKAYPPVTIDGVRLTPEASVTISVSNNPRENMTSIDYDIDITLELWTESEELADFFESLLDEAKEDIDIFSSQLKDQMEVGLAAREAIKEAEEAKSEIINEAIEEDIVVPVGIFDEFDVLLAQAKSALDVGNYQEARQFAKRAEETLDGVERAINKLKELKEKTEEGLEGEEPGRTPEGEEVEQFEETEEQRPVRPGRPRQPEAQPEINEDAPGDEDNNRRTGVPCRTDEDCVVTGMACPMVVGSDTLQCGAEGVCFCGPGRSAVLTE